VNINEENLIAQFVRLMPNINSRPSDEVAEGLIALVRAIDATVVHPTQDPKYSIRDNRLVNAERNEEIPADEPVFVFRARDALSVHALSVYLELCRQNGRPMSHQRAVYDRLVEFQKFAETNPGRMKYPTTGGTAQEESISYVQPPKFANPDQELLSALNPEKIADLGISKELLENGDQPLPPTIARQGDVVFRQQSEGKPLTDEDMPG